MKELTADGLTQFEASYFETALWSSTDGEGTPFDSKYSDVKLSDEARSRIVSDCYSFKTAMQPLVDTLDETFLSTKLLLERWPHDFWLTRNHHGAGFWDGDYPEPLGTQLTDIAHSFGECYLYVGDDGKWYIS